jgi:hypothetical protein
MKLPTNGIPTDRFCRELVSKIFLDGMVMLMPTETFVSKNVKFKCSSDFSSNRFKIIGLRPVNQVI